MKNVITSVALCLFLSLSLSLSASSSTKPNIILIMVDDMGAQHIGAYGGVSYVKGKQAKSGGPVSTPNIDALASSGMMFRNAHNLAACVPARACILTGRYPYRSGVPSNGTGDTKTLSWGEGEITFGNLLQDAGYATALAGKWHLTQHDRNPNHLNDRGFGNYCVFGWQTDADEKSNFAPPVSRRFWAPTIFRDGVWDLSHVDAADPDGDGNETWHKNLTWGPDVYCQYLMDFMEEQVENEKPFLAYYPMALIHSPWPQTPLNVDDPQSGWSNSDNLRTTSNTKYSQQNLESMMAYVDVLVGRITDKVTELGIENDTVIIFTSDNGTIAGGRVNINFSEAGAAPVVVPGGKFRVTDSGIRAPFIVSWPGKIAPGTVNNNLVDLTDVLPTLAELAGSSAPTDRMIDGMSLVPQLLGEPNAPAREWMYNRYGDDVVIRDGQYRLSRNGDLHNMLSNRYNPTRVGRRNSLPTNPDALESYRLLEDAYTFMEHPYSGALPVLRLLDDPIYTQYLIVADDFRRAGELGVNGPADGVSDLNGSAPNFSLTSDVWSANANIKSNLGKADLTGSGTQAALYPFTPVAGNVYRLSAALTPGVDDAVNVNGLGIGFTGAEPGLAFGYTASPLLLSAGCSEDGQFKYRGKDGAARVFADSSGDIRGRTYKVELILDTRETAWSYAIRWVDASGNEVASVSDTWESNPVIANVAMVANSSNSEPCIAKFRLEIVPEGGARITELTSLPGDTLRLKLEPDADTTLESYRVFTSTDLKNWYPAAHSDTEDGNFFKGNFKRSTDAGGDAEIYLKQEGERQFFRVE